MNIAKVLNAKGLACPMPIVKTKKAISEIESGQILQVLATDKGSKADITAWSGSQGHELLNISEENGVFIFNIKKM
ncbi:sulfurtransferase TusA family protein [Bacillus sp. FJAT-49711]|uniref:sulfurtransferase TusA family protein n=1 Tax=Bacillus sp. FJAT-49711 TaxID=2833585 RepID=UPI001BC90312|nr:sulfurtransferase TusA family protein [Bacillus sp. FJAT-49711]MBS4218672.1 sulfurtransferase TusA family protein [Bacillus sp. FJAT-49711]